MNRAQICRYAIPATVKITDCCHLSFSLVPLINLLTLLGLWVCRARDLLRDGLVRILDIFERLTEIERIPLNRCHSRLNRVVHLLFQSVCPVHSLLPQQAVDVKLY